MLSVASPAPIVPPLPPEVPRGSNMPAASHLLTVTEVPLRFLDQLLVTQCRTPLMIDVATQGLEGLQPVMGDEVTVSDEQPSSARASCPDTVYRDRVAGLDEHRV